MNIAKMISVTICSRILIPSPDLQEAIIHILSLTVMELRVLISSFTIVVQDYSVLFFARMSYILLFNCNFHIVFHVVIMNHSPT